MGAADGAVGVGARLTAGAQEDLRGAGAAAAASAAIVNTAEEVGSARSKRPRV